MAVTGAAVLRGGSCPGERGGWGAGWRRDTGHYLAEVVSYGFFGRHIGGVNIELGQVVQGNHYNLTIGSMAFAFCTS